MGSDVTLDHIVPQCEGGSDNITNLQAAHKACNEAKGRWVADNLEESPGDDRVFYRCAACSHRGLYDADTGQCRSCESGDIWRYQP